MSDHDFINRVADRLAALPSVRTVALGGSRVADTYRADSDWDFGIYYRDTFDPQTPRDTGWTGEASEIGGWGGWPASQAIWW